MPLARRCSLIEINLDINKSFVELALPIMVKASLSVISAKIPEEPDWGSVI